MYLFSRIVGAASEANVQLSIAILTDISTPETRAKSLALVGLCFSLAFTLGPPIGAQFAGKALTAYGERVNIYAYPALITVALLSLETTLLYFFLPETKLHNVQNGNSRLEHDPALSHENRKDPDSENRINFLSWIYFLFLFIFGGRCLWSVFGWSLI